MKRRKARRFRDLPRVIEIERARQESQQDRQTEEPAAHVASVSLLPPSKPMPPILFAATARINELLLEAKALVAKRSFAQNTQKAYRADWKGFLRWCVEEQGFAEEACFPTPPALVVAWLMELKERRKISTLERALAAISHRHNGAGYLSPTEDASVRYAWKAIKRDKGVRKQRRAAALPLDLLVEMIEAQERVTRPFLAIRNRAMLAIGFFGGLRVSEIVDLRLEHLTWEREGLVLLIPRAKGDQMGEGREIAIPYREQGGLGICAPTLLRRWLEAAGLSTEQRGHLWRTYGKGLVGGSASQEGRFPFLTGGGFAGIFKASLRAIGEDPTAYSVHSLRAGIATLLALEGAEEREIQDHLRHADPKQTRKYIRVAERWSKAALRHVIKPQKQK